MKQIWKSILAIAIIAITSRSTIARELSEIESQGKLKVAVKNNLRPLGFTDRQGNLIGLEIDLARQLAEELLGDEKAIEFLVTSNQERLQVVLDREVDIAIAKVSVTDSRARIVNFSSYYYLDGTGIITNNPNVQDLADLKKSKILLLQNSASIAVIRHKLPQATLVGVESYQQALELLENQQADGFAGDRSILAGWIQEYPRYKLLPSRLSGEALAIVMPKGLQYQELRSKINKTISEWKKSGWLQERIEYWGL